MYSRLNGDGHLYNQQTWESPTRFPLHHSETPRFRLAGITTEGDQHDSKAMNPAADSSLHAIILHSSAQHPHHHHHHHPPLLTPHFNLLCTVWISITSSSFLLACSILLPPLISLSSVTLPTFNTPSIPLTLLTKR